MTAIANGYFDGIERHDSRLVRSAVDCNRFENGVQMTNRRGALTPRACATAVDRLTHIKAVPERRYDVVDEECPLAEAGRLVRCHLGRAGPAAAIGRRRIPSAARLLVEQLIREVVRLASIP